MRKMKCFILRNWIPLTVGFLVTAWAVNNQYHARGYMAMGSEWLITPFLVFLNRGINSFVRHDLPIWIEILGGETSGNAKRNRRHRKAVQGRRR